MERNTPNLPNGISHGEVVDDRLEKFENVTGWTDDEILAKAKEWLGYDVVFLPHLAGAHWDIVAANAVLMTVQYGDEVDETLISYDEGRHWKRHEGIMGQMRLLPLTRYCTHVMRGGRRFIGQRTAQQD